MHNPLKLFEDILSCFSNHTKWDEAPFRKIKTISNTKVGSVGQSFIEKLCEDLSIPYIFPTNPTGKRLTQNSWDIKIYDISFELKTATEDTSGKFQFNHIRYHRPYQGLICLGVSPENLYFGVWSKAGITTGKAGSLVTMEKSANASYKLTKSIDQLHPIIKFQEEIKIFSTKFNTTQETAP
jgi:hypothetical protein